MGTRYKEIRHPRFLECSSLGWLASEKQGVQTSKPLSLHLEQLENRMLMDGAGFVHTDPPEDPDSIVGVAEVSALDDHREFKRGTVQLRLDPLANDELPEGSESLRIKSVSATKLGHTVTITEDGRNLLYDAGEGGLQAGDTFYYIVESDDGKLGKANVNLTLQKETFRGGGVTPRHDISDDFDFFEDTQQQQLDVLRNDREFSDGEIIAVVLQSSYYDGPLDIAPPSGMMQIAEDGKSLLYQPSTGFSGREYYTYTVRNESGEEVTTTVRIDIEKPIELIGYPNDRIQLDAGTGDSFSPILFTKTGPTPDAPVVELITAPDYAGEFLISADGKQITYQPNSDFAGNFELSYTVRYGTEEYQFVTGKLHYQVDTAFLAVENWFTVTPESGETQLGVLQNDPAWQRRVGYDFIPPVELSVASVSAGDQGGKIRVSEDGKFVIYKPAAGFRGDETFTYEVLASNGARGTATVTVHVAEEVSDPSGINRFKNEGELQQFLIDKAVMSYGQRFGLFEARYESQQDFIYNRFAYHALLAADTVSGVSPTNTDHSETNTQINGVDEADIVETDGHYVYTFTDGRLVIVDVSDTSTPRAVSFTDFSSRFDLMYLQGDRMTLIRNGSAYGGGAELVVLDISDRAAPTVVERTEIDGYVADSRAIGDRVHLVVKSSFKIPELEGEWIVEPTTPASSTELKTYGIDIGGRAIASDVIALDYHAGYWNNGGERGIWRNESLDEYVERVRDSLIETSLPSFRSYNADGELIDSGLLTGATSIHKPVAGSDLLVSLLSFDADDADVGPLAEATSFVSDSNIEVFVSTTAAYVFAYDSSTASSNIYQLAFATDGTLPIVASGTVGGSLLNQFSADEHEGYLRIATTEVRLVEIETSRGIRRVQQQRFNNVAVFEQQGNQLAKVGEVTNLAPTETIHSVRFMGDRAFVVTFRLVDPLFALDMSDPTSPTVEGALKIPGFSNYLHPVGSDYLIGIGRDADEITGRRGPLQITLFNVSDLSNPYVADQLTFEGANWVNSEAWIDHHAVSFFAESGVLAIPISWSEQIEPNGESSSLSGHYQSVKRSAIWTLKVDVSNPENVSIESTGSVEHEAASYSRSLPPGWTNSQVWWGGWTYDPGSPARRSLRVGESLITVSNEYVKINDLHDPSIEIGQAYLGQLAQDDEYVIDEDSGRNVLRVRANDLSDSSSRKAKITSVSQPTDGGVVKVSRNGKRLIFTPEDNFFGEVTFSYTTFDRLRGEETAYVKVNIKNVPDDPTAVDDEFVVEINGGATILSVRANDINPDANVHAPLQWNPIVCDCLHSHTDFTLVSLPIEDSNGLIITSVGETDQNGTVEIDDWGRLVYTPADGFEGFETFSYTIETRLGLTDVGSVTVKVGDPQITEERLSDRISKIGQIVLESTNRENANSLTKPNDDALRSDRSSLLNQEISHSRFFEVSNRSSDTNSRELALDRWGPRWLNLQLPNVTWFTDHGTVSADSLFGSIGKANAEEFSNQLKTALFNDEIFSDLG